MRDLAPEQGTTLAPAIGDKVRLKAGPYRGLRGYLVTASAQIAMVSLDTGETTEIAYHEMVNYSLAARRAWQSMPKRAVGRPRAAGGPRKQVSVRIDCETWEGLQWAVDLGLIPSREQAINDWLRAHLAELRARASDVRAEGSEEYLLSKGMEADPPPQ